MCTLPSRFTNAVIGIVARAMTAVLLDKEESLFKVSSLFLIAVLATGVIFPIYYFGTYSSDTTTLVSFFTAEHESFKLTKEQIQALGGNSPNAVVTYSFKNWYRNEMMSIKLIARAQMCGGALSILAGMATALGNSPEATKM